MTSVMLQHSEYITLLLCLQISIQSLHIYMQFILAPTIIMLKLAIPRLWYPLLLHSRPMPSLLLLYPLWQPDGGQCHHAVAYTLHLLSFSVYNISYATAQWIHNIIIMLTDFNSVATCIHAVHISPYNSYYNVEIGYTSFLMSTAAPQSTNAFTASTSPHVAASWRAVSPCCSINTSCTIILCLQHQLCYSTLLLCLQISIQSLHVYM